MESLPIEIVNKIMLYVSSPTADCIKELLSRGNLVSECIKNDEVFKYMRNCDLGFELMSRWCHTVYYISKEEWLVHPFCDRKCDNGFNYIHPSQQDFRVHPLAVGNMEISEYDGIFKTSDFYVK